MDDLVKRLRDFPVRDCCSQRAEAADRIEALEKALRKLDDMIYELDAGGLDLYEVGDFIDAALGEKKDG